MITATQNTASGPVAGASQTPAKPVLSSDFETFLKMLTVQMRNQDPLNPADTTEFATQLATFSSLEQQVLSNALLQSISNALAGSGPLGQAALLGAQVQVTGPVPFAGSPVELAVSTAPSADNATLTVRNESGAIVQTLPFAPGETNLLWAGVDDDGSPLPAGDYTFAVESWSGDSFLDTRQPARFGTVTELRQGDNGTLLILDDGSAVESSAITGLRQPPAQTG
ncbi:MAG: hypothetical protein KDK26_00015 [Roseivivax sp.]|nr:hypothetical protein [Roseivivax sp.]